MRTITTDLLLIETAATNEAAARARIEFAATKAYGAARPQLIAFRQDRLVALDDERRLVYAWRALVHDLAATPPTPEPDAAATAEAHAATA
jgi:hypothetical protein